MPKRIRRPASDVPVKPSRDAVPSTAVAGASRPDVGRNAQLQIGLGVALALAVWLIATEPGLAIVWDEGYTLARRERVVAWLRAVWDPPSAAASWRPETLLPIEDRLPAPRANQVRSRAALMGDHAVIRWFWPFAREEPHGHPPFYAIVGLIGEVLTPNREPLARARLGPMLVFAAAGGALAAFARRLWGGWATLAAAGAWGLQPRLFGHAHYATYDALLTSLWVAALLAFLAAVERPDEPSESSQRRRWTAWAWTTAFGILYGLAMGTKLTGWFLAIPCLAWSLVYCDRRAIRTLLVALPIALATVILLTPPWWRAPIAGLVEFFRSNLTRARTIPIETMFLGRIYETPTGSLPWTNTLVWTLFVTPAGFLALSLIGAALAVRHLRTERAGVLLAGNWLFFLVLRALPHTPGHDGVRQFLPAFGLLAAVAGLGAGWMVKRGRRLGRLVVGTAVLEGVLSIALMYPVPLSYYSPIVGGLPGATALGMEPTYYWDALDDGARDWLNRNTPPGRTVMFATNPVASWMYLRETGRLTAGITPLDRGVPAWYVLQNRPGAMRPIDLRLVARADQEGRVLSAKLGVPLVWAFPHESFLQAAEESR